MSGRYGRKYWNTYTFILTLYMPYGRNQHKKKHWMTPIIQCLIKRRSGFTLPGLIVNPLTRGKWILETEFSNELVEKAFEIRKNAVAHSNQPETISISSPKGMAHNVSPDDDDICTDDLELKTSVED